MIVGSTFSGVGGMDLGLQRAGFDHAFFAELDPWRRDVLAAHWPGVPTYDDVAAVDKSAWPGGIGVGGGTLDARHGERPGRRVFIVGHSGGDDELALRALCSGCGGDLEAGDCSWQNTAGSVGSGANGTDMSPAIGRTSIGMGIQSASVGVRRLTPVECERLMSWPDGWTAPDGVKAPDSRRYAACGDGVVSNVSEWIGRRIAALDELALPLDELEAVTL